MASFDNIYSLRKSEFRERITVLGPARRAELCRVLDTDFGCLPPCR